jgi:DNA polymerase I
MLIQSIKALPDLLSIPKLIALDFETKEGTMDIEGFSFAFYDGKRNRGYFIPVDYPFDEDDPWENIPKDVILAYLKKLVRKRRVVFHNAQFDLTVLKNVGIDIDLAYVEDTMLLHWDLDTERPHGLKAIMKKERPEMAADYVTYEEARNQSFDEFASYGERDARATLWLYHRLVADAQDHEKTVRLYRTVEIPFIPVLQEMNYFKNYVRIDQKLLLHYVEMLDGEIARVEALLRKHIGDFNYRSGQKLAPALRKLGYRINVTEKGNPSLGEGELQEMQKQQKHIAIPLILYYRGLQKLQSTYVRGLYDKLLCKDGVYYITGYDFAHIGTRSGRLSAHNPNLQNQPRSPVPMRIPVVRYMGKSLPMNWEKFEEKHAENKRFKKGMDTFSIDMRKVFIAMPGYMFIGADYSQLELRMMAHLSKDPVMCDAYMNNRDIHQELADKLSHWVGQPISRQWAKTLNFFLQYGGYYTSLARHLNISVTLAKKIWDGYNVLFAGRTAYVKALHQSARRSHFVQTILGRRRNVNSIGINDSDNFGAKNYAQNASVSHAVSGSSSDLIKLAMIQIHAKYPELRCVMQIHDELLYEVKEKYAKKYLSIVKAEMEGAMKLRIPIIADAQIGKSWREVH